MEGFDQPPPAGAQAPMQAKSSLNADPHTSDSPCHRHSLTAVNNSGLTAKTHNDVSARARHNQRGSRPAVTTGKDGSEGSGGEGGGKGSGGEGGGEGSGDGNGRLGGGCAGGRGGKRDGWERDAGPEVLVVAVMVVLAVLAAVQVAADADIDG